MSELIDKSTQSVAGDEGFGKFLYFDINGIPTIAFGRNLRTKGVSKEEGKILLSNDISDAILQLNNALPWFSSLSINRQVVLVNMEVNLGLHGTILFKNFLNYMQHGQYKEAAGELRNSKAYRRLTRRYERLARITESDIYECE